MAPRETEVGQEEFKSHRPLFDGIATAIMDSLRGCTVEQLGVRSGISMKLAAGLQRMVYEFPNKSLGMRAVRAFTGVVFRQLHPDAYDEAQYRFLDDNVRIISSLYGWLRPDDMIKPYRFDFTSRVAPGDEALMKYWKTDVTTALVRDLQERDDRVIIDLLPSEASRCVDWKLVKRFAGVYKVAFKTMIGPDEMKTPNSGRLKELRGRLLDLIIRGRLSSPQDVAALESSDFMPDPTEQDSPSFLSFVTV